MLLQITAMVLVAGFAVIAAIGHVLLIQAILVIRRDQRPPTAATPVVEADRLAPPSVATLEHQRAA